MKNVNIQIKGLKLHKNGRLFGFGTSPNADWKVIFIIFVLLFVIASALCIDLFIKVNNGEIFVVKEKTSTPVPTLNTALLDKTVTYYRDRAKTLEDIKANRDATVDPSL
ncbi:MAG: hypothetical protein JWN89_625 [Parcubacteria group bacterium]|nr:hypothetical protein [Parcubacteria group bacterium]